MTLIFAVMRAGLVGALLCGAVGTMAAVVVYAGDGEGLGVLASQTFRAGLTLTVAALPVWIVGLVIVGLPVLIAMRRLGLTDRRAAAVTGAVLAGAGPTAVVLLGASTDVLRAVLWLAPIGAVVGPVLRARILGPEPAPEARPGV